MEAKREEKTSADLWSEAGGKELGYGGIRSDSLQGFCSSQFRKKRESLRARSLAFYNEKYSPEICVRISLTDYKQTENLYDVPLYMIGSLCCQE